MEIIFGNCFWNTFITSRKYVFCTLYLIHLQKKKKYPNTITMLNTVKLKKKLYVKLWYFKMWSLKIHEFRFRSNYVNISFMSYSRAYLSYYCWYVLIYTSGILYIMRRACFQSHRKFGVCAALPQHSVLSVWIGVDGLHLRRHWWLLMHRPPVKKLTSCLKPIEM